MKPWQKFLIVLGLGLLAYLGYKIFTAVKAGLSFTEAVKAYTADLLSSFVNLVKLLFRPWDWFGVVGDFLKYLQDRYLRGADGIDAYNEFLVKFYKRVNGDTEVISDGSGFSADIP